ncbi:MAG: 3-dehydroquinate synthase [Clostridiales bacterium]|uniref:3-dehydroquinate synthase n=1 Tax=unclassified Intestinimonas TaxID=2685768 RepID=UPI0006C6ED7F|nr:3-dehydroquinate synthase [Intestinimonas sp. UBA1698]MDU1324358.1 3-dehydroquinate synthase [Clostridiales bacterium]BDE86062.1 3-dehydroquinate synthase [Oscillospiraceae bacterium]CUQ00052.1 3-dehydroquinate synthase [Flavonifractor plautii]SCJ34690.1 3-dehydroquinate synthase [uncultured Flavonifractor sp.]
MKLLPVSLGDRSYDIHIAPGRLDDTGKLCQQVLPRATRLAVVTDDTVGGLYAHRLLQSLWARGYTASVISLPAGEQTKSLHNLGVLYDSFMEMGLTRTDAVVALGGGVVGDLAGFAAATILRGVDFVQVPTTLLAQVDSSVGGKVAIDLPAGKNLAGAFWQPRLVVMDPEVLDTLEDKTFSDGMAEVIKYGCIRDAAFFRALEKTPSRRAVMENIESVLYTCCDLKRAVVEKDERDTGERMVLNFGHTLGHAYEKAGHYETWTHGQAVAAGMCLAARLGAALGVTPAGVPERVEALVSAFGLPTRIPCTQADYAAAVGLDKKGTGEQITLVLLEDLGRAVLHRMSKRELLGLLEGCAE